MLTIKEMNEASFGKAGFSGYNPEDVDNFIDQVVASFQQLMAEKDEANQKVAELSAKNAELSAKTGEMREKLAILAEKVESYRHDEDGIKDALISAQRLARDSVQEAKDKASIILEDAKSSAQKMLDAAKIEASKAAKEYMAQAEAKKAELEEMKRQVSTFRVSLLEMYKKHLECINRIPNFKQKEAQEQPVKNEAAHEETATQPEPVEPVAEPVLQQPEQPVQYADTSVPQELVQEEQAEEILQEPEDTYYEEQPVPTLHDKVNYTQEQFQDTLPIDEDYIDDDLSDVGIDLKTYSNIPETLKREKNSHFSNLEFGEDVDISQKKHKK